MNKRTFEKIIKRNAITVKTWPKWKQEITISAKAAETGKYLEKG